MLQCARSAVGNIAGLGGRAPGVTAIHEGTQLSFGEVRDAPEDVDLDRVAHALAAKDPTGAVIAKVLRSTLDTLLDGQRTGRYDYDQLPEFEKSRFAPLVASGLQQALKLGNSADLHLEISGANLGCHLSREPWAWLFPAGAAGSLALLLCVNDKKSRWCAGLTRISPDALTQAVNRDGKRMISGIGRRSVRILFWDAPLQENTLLQMPEADVRAIFERRSGQQRVDELFRRAQRRPVSRTAVATVAQQVDYMKRVRYDGGSRSRLQPEGIVIFGQYHSHQEAAAALGLPVPQDGQSVSARLARYRPELHGHAARISLDDVDWVVARRGDPAEPVPRLPKAQPNDS
jgi:hypothetical protein